VARYRPQDVGRRAEEQLAARRVFDDLQLLVSRGEEVRGPRRGPEEAVAVLYLFYAKSNDSEREREREREKERERGRRSVKFFLFSSEVEVEN